MSDQDVSKMKVVDLKLELKKRGLSTTGNKNELQDRLQAALADSGDILEESTAISDDLLDDELIDDDLDEKDLLEHDQEDELLSPSPESEKKKNDIKSPKSPVGGNATSTTDQPPVHKKISLKRNLAIQAPVLPQTSKPVSGEDTVKPISSSDDSEDNASAKKMKLTILTAEERLKLRAQKFGATPVAVSKSDSSGDERKLARAARFGISSTNSNSSASIKNSAPDTSLEVLKKRAERFGAAIAPKLSAVENEEKLKKRQERFGAVSSTNIDTDKAKLARLERFKPAA